jgi:ornithine cyclodeaminase
MQFFDQAAVSLALPYPALIDALATGLQQPIESPARSVHAPNGDHSAVLIMPAWKSQHIMGVKLVSIWPGNSAKGKSAVSAVYVLISCEDGNPVAVLDGTELTLRRTAAAAALAARILARKNSQTLAILGTGSLSAPMAVAHASVMNFKTILVWGRNLKKAQGVVDNLALQGITAHASDDLQATLAQADVVSAASTATEPFIHSDWVMPGTHLGLIGAFTPTMAEAEPALMPRAQVFADSREAILQKGGEVLQAIQQGLMAAGDIQAELAEIAAQPQRAWRQSEEAITVFKSVGFASLDLIAAEMVFKAASQSGK